jgi:hypothetical protein
MMRTYNIKLSLKIVLVCLIFFYGLGVGRYEWFPFSVINKTKNLFKYQSIVKFDNFGRLIYSSNHKEISCPIRNEKLGVIVSFGQSNSANYAERLYKPNELKNVINYFDGRCYIAQSPLLGADGAKGEWISLTANNLVEKGIYNKVIIVSSGIGGTSIKRWAKGNDLNKMFIEVISSLSKKYIITDIIWHQGESDKQTHGKVYKFYFETLVESIRNSKINAPIFISIASNCGEEKNWNYPNEISEAQLELTQIDGVEFGLNTDQKIPFSLRYDKCHFGKLGQKIAADELATSISKYHKFK